jgi:hypothetical protein
MSTVQRWQIDKLQADVQRLMVRLQQAEAHIEELSQRLAAGPVRYAGKHPALGASYGDCRDIIEKDPYEALAESIIQGPTGIFPTEDDSE